MLDGVVLILALILNPRAKRRRQRERDAEAQSQLQTQEQQIPPPLTPHRETPDDTALSTTPAGPLDQPAATGNVREGKSLAEKEAVSEVTADKADRR